MINNHNRKVLNKEKRSTNKTTKNCNCKVKASCPLKGNCIQETVIYKATVSANSEEKTYIGSTEGLFKQRYYNHKSDFTNEANKYNTALATYIWECKNNNIETSVSWEILRHCNKYRGGRRKCDLCLTEKLLILQNKTNPLNKRSELMGKCRHLRKFKLQMVKK